MVSRSSALLISKTRTPFFLSAFGQNFRFCSTSSTSTNNKNNNNDNNNTEEIQQEQQQLMKKKTKTQSKSNTNEAENNTTTTTTSTNQTKSASFQIPPGVEVYAGCVFIVAGWWYWNEASYRRIDRACEGVETQAKEKAKQLTGVVNATETRWREDVRGKEQMLTKVHAENVRLAKLLDDVTNYLKRCNVPMA